jgi:hypothetical protein
MQVTGYVTSTDLAELNTNKSQVIRLYSGPGFSNKFKVRLDLTDWVVTDEFTDGDTAVLTLKYTK